MSVSIVQQIAKKVGVSPRTVQRILGGEVECRRPSIARRAQRIRALAEVLDYRPNLAAKATASGRFGCVSLVRPTAGWATHYSAEMAEGIEGELSLHDMHLTVHRLSDEQLRSPRLFPKVLRTMMSDGLLANYTHQIPATMREVIEHEAIPTVWMNTKFEHDCVHPDDFSAGRMATEYLIGRGKRRIAYVQLTHSGGHFSEEDRKAGYLWAMEQAGLTPRVAMLGDLAPADGLPTYGRDRRFALALDWLKGSDRPDAVVTYSERSALPLMGAALSLGLKFPDDLAVTTLDTLIDRVATELGFPVTTVVLNAGEMGRQAVRMLLRKIERPQERIPSLVIPCTLVCGETA